MPTDRPEPTRIFDRALIERRRDRAARAAEGHDFLLARVADDLAERLADRAARVSRWRPTSARTTGSCRGASQGIAGIERIVDVERSLRLLSRCGALRVVADEEALPFADASLDLAVSGLSLQLVNDLPGTLVQMRRALKPDGLLLASLLGGATLKELRQAWLAAEAELDRRRLAARCALRRRARSRRAAAARRLCAARRRLRRR